MHSSLIKLGSSLLGPVLLGIAYCALATLSLALTSRVDGVATLWPPSGLLLATLLVAPRRRLWRFALAAFVASCVANVVAGVSLLSAVGFSTANIVEASVVTLLLRRQGGSRISFLDPQGLSKFFLASLVGAATSCSIAVLVAPVPNWSFAFSWLTTVWLGMLLVAPPLVILVEISAAHQLTTARPGAAKLLSVVLLSVASSGATFFQNSFPILFVPMMMIILAVLRCGALGGIISMIIAATMGSIAITLGLGISTLISSSHQTNILFFQIYLLALLVSALPMASLLAVRDRLRINLDERIRLLSQAEKSAHIGHWRIDPRRQALYWSPEVYRIHGRQVGDPPAFDRAIDLFHPDDRAMVTATIDTAMNDGTPFEFGARLVLPNGSIRHVISRGERDYSSKNNAIGLFGLLQDVTEHVEAQRLMREAREAAERSEKRALAWAETDVLTGLANRRKIMRQLAEAISKVSAGNGPLCVAIFDIDHFKAINDRYGHITGDEVIRLVGRSVASALRTTDMIGRYGGEEFILILSNTTPEVAMAIADRVRLIVAAGDATTIQPLVTVSMGIATYDGAESIESVLKRADAALYLAKAAGRNRLRLAA